MIVDDHIANLKKKCARNYHPSYSTCVDESMYIFYGTLGNWINDGLAQYTEIDRKK